MARRKYLLVQRRLNDELDPNNLPEPVVVVRSVSLAPTCRFLGIVFEEGDEICFGGDGYVCRSGSWQRNGRRC